MAVKLAANGFYEEFITRSTDGEEQVRMWECECGFLNDHPAHYVRKNLKCMKCKEPIEREYSEYSI